ncbi:hypothetical protein FKM82_018231 [Ascaphus truei]
MHAVYSTGALPLTISRQTDYRRRGKTGRFIYSTCCLPTERYRRNLQASPPSSYYMPAGYVDLWTYSVRDGKGRLLLLMLQ